MFELTATFTPVDGNTPRPITLRISDVRQDKPGDWSVAVAVLGFPTSDENVRLRGADWAETIELAARFIASVVTWKIELAGGGALDPPIHPVQEK